MIGFGILNCTIAPDAYRYRASLPNAIQYFLAGFLLADIYLLHGPFLQRKHFIWDIVAVIFSALIVISMQFGGGMWGTLTFHLPICMLLIYIAGFKGPLLNRLFRNPAVFLIGGMCYTIYLYHGHLVSLLAVITHPLYIHSLPAWVNYPIHFVIHAAVVLAASTILFVLIERPCMKRDWPQQLWRRLRGKRHSGSDH